MKTQRSSLFRRNLRALREARRFKPLDADSQRRNLPGACPAYQRLLDDLDSAGWTRFAAGFKAALYGHPDHIWCLKVLGMGVGENPLYFCGHGHILQHERNMLNDFQREGFRFGPSVLSVTDSIAFLTEKCGVTPEEATVRCKNSDVLILEYLPGVPIASWTGTHIDCDLSPGLLDRQFLLEAEKALYTLRSELVKANRRGLLHNDPVLPNILLILDEDDHVSARLVDFELAQNLNRSSPGHVAVAVEELYRERAVPRNPETGRHLRNLDQHLIAGAIEAVRRIREMAGLAENERSPKTGLPPVLPIIPELGGINLDLQEAFESLAASPFGAPFTSCPKLKVFLCHSSNDKRPAQDLCQQLRGENFDPWLDQERILPGQDWRREIERAVRGADTIIICLSGESVNKDGFIQREIKIALDAAEEKREGSIFVIPARLEDCEVPERLQRYQWVDLFADEGFELLLSALRLRAGEVDGQG